MRTIATAATMLILADCGGSPPEATGRLDDVRVESARVTAADDLQRLESTTFADPRPDPAPVVEWGFAEVMARRVECGRDPWNCDVDEIAVADSPAHRYLDDLFERRRRHGITASSKGAMTYDVEGIEEVSPDVAHVSACFVDDVVLVMKVPGGGPPAIYDESMSSYRVVFVVRRTTVGWRLVDFTSTDRAMGVNLCDAA